MEQINHPDYYSNCSPKTRHIVAALGIPGDYHDWECLDVVELFGMDFALGAIVTHLWRYDKKKGEEYKDLCKAEWYLLHLYEKFSASPIAHEWKTAAGLVRELIKSEFPDGK